MDNSSFMILAALFIAVVLVVNSFRSRGNKRRISLYLYRQGASQVVVYLILLSGDHSNFVYDVEYTDRQGRQREAQCKVSSAWWRDGEIFWSIPPEV